MPETPEEKKARHAAYWKANVRLIAVLLSIWGAVSLVGSVLLARPLNDAVSVGSAPGGFWLAQQGSIFTFVVLIAVYVFMMDRIDRAHHILDEDEDESP